MNTRNNTSSPNVLGLAMTGGGARGAYQAGVLKRIGEIRALRNTCGPFGIIGGASAGAVNGTAIAAGTHDFHRCTQWLAELWANLSSQEIYRSDVMSLLPKAGNWIRDLSVGALVGGGHATSLLDATPLRRFLARHLKVELIQKNINRGNLRALTIAATNYTSGKTYLFIQSTPDCRLWSKSRRIAMACPITVDHIRASAAIPIVFQAVPLQTATGIEYFGDGCLRLPAPLSPVIRLGAEKILAIGVRSQKASEESHRERVTHFSDKKRKIPEPPPIAQVLGVSLNAIFLDHLDTDIEHLQRLNQIITHMKLSDSVIQGINEPMKIIQPLAVTPSQDLGKIAESYEKRMPATVRYLMAGLGTKVSPSSDLLSYLLFDSSYTRALIDLGYRDAHAQIDQIENFILA